MHRSGTGGLVLGLSGALLRAVRRGLLGPDPAGVGQPVASRPGHDRHCPGRRDHAGQRRYLRRPWRHRRAAWCRRGCPAGLAHHGIRWVAGRQLQHLPVPARDGPDRVLARVLPGWLAWTAYRSRSCSSCLTSSASWPCCSSWSGRRQRESACHSRRQARTRTPRRGRSSERSVMRKLPLAARGRRRNRHRVAGASRGQRGQCGAPRHPPAPLRHRIRPDHVHVAHARPGQRHRSRRVHRSRSDSTWAAPGPAPWCSRAVRSP